MASADRLLVADDDEWNTSLKPKSGSAVHVPAAGAPRVVRSGQPFYEPGGRAGTGRAASGWTLTQLCLVMAGIIALAAIGVSIAALVKADHHHAPAPVPAALGVGLASERTASSPQTPAPSATTTTNVAGPNSVLRTAVLQAAPVQLGSTGSPLVELEFLCNEQFGNGTCLAVFSYTNHAGELVTAAAGTDDNKVEPGPADRGQPEVFAASPVLDNGVELPEYGAAAFAWNCAAHTRAVWTLRTGPAGSSSVAEAPSSHVPCQPLPI